LACVPANIFDSAIVFVAANDDLFLIFSNPVTISLSSVHFKVHVGVDARRCALVTPQGTVFLACVPANVFDSAIIFVAANDDPILIHSNPVTISLFSVHYKTKVGVDARCALATSQGTGELYRKFVASVRYRRRVSFHPIATLPFHII